MLKEELEKGVVAIIGPKDDRDDPKKVIIIFKNNFLNNYINIFMQLDNRTVF